MVTVMSKLRGMHAQDPLAFQVRARHGGSVIEDQRHNKDHTDPRENPAPGDAAVVLSAAWRGPWCSG